jgi:pseudaminic acid synthase
MKIADFDFNSNRTFIIAELSANHNGSLQTAIDTIKAAKKAGADAIKLQTYTADTITLDSTREEFIIKGGTLWDNQSLYKLYQEAYTPWEWHPKLFQAAQEEGLICFSTPFDESAVDFLRSFNPPAYKIASFEITDHALIRYCAREQKPIIISIGTATADEIEEAITICREENNNNIILLQCTSSYPAPLEKANLRTIPDLAKRFDLLAGLSDHTLGSTAPVAAVALGARVIEKHFILDKSIGGPDAAFSLDFEAFSDMVRSVRETEQLLGEITYEMDDFKLKNRRFCRSLYVSAPIKKGEQLNKQNIKSVRPFNGLHPRYLESILGKSASCDLDFGTPLRLEDIENI